MTYSIPTLDAIRDAILTDWRNLDQTAVVDTDSDNFVRASGMASAIMGLYQYFAYGVNQIWPDTQDWDNLVRFGTVRNVVPIPPVRAVGNVQCTGTVGAVIPANTIVQVGTLNYRTLQQVVINAQGSATAPLVAMDGGVAGNQPNATPARLQSAPLGVNAATLITDMIGGADAETKQAYLGRVLERLRLPPAGGNRHDFEVWTRQVPGVSYVQVYPLRRGLGRVDVAILINGVPATDAQRRTIWAYLDARAPAGGELLVATYQLMPVDVTARLTLASGTDAATVTAAAQAGLASYFATLKPGDTVLRSRLLLILSDIAGVIDVDLPSPAASVPIWVDATRLQLATLGTVIVITQ
jgi:uncharacterized phage protein gp47/JayE